MRTAWLLRGPGASRHDSNELECIVLCMIHRAAPEPATRPPGGPKSEDRKPDEPMINWWRGILYERFFGFLPFWSGGPVLPEPGWRRIRPPGRSGCFPIAGFKFNQTLSVQRPYRSPWVLHRDPESDPRGSLAVGAAFPVSTLIHCSVATDEVRT